MSSARRSKIRKSFLAMLVSFLRGDGLDTSKFTTVSGVTGSYPFSDDVWCFSLNGSLYQIKESATPRTRLPIKKGLAPMSLLPMGVTVLFGSDTPEPSRSMPQIMRQEIGIAVRTPLVMLPSQESTAQLIALKIDQVLYRSGGLNGSKSMLEIKDYDVHPSVSTGSSMNWQKVPRGTWEFQDVNTPIEDYRMSMDILYPQPQEEWQ